MASDDPSSPRPDDDKPRAWTSPRQPRSPVVPLFGHRTRGPRPEHFDDPDRGGGREPMFNLPLIILGLIGVFVLVHAIYELLPSARHQGMMLAWLAFIPQRYLPPEISGFLYPGGLAADLWTFLTYSFLHGDWIHLGVNVIWMAAFGSAVARRFGAWRFCLLSALGAIGGAALHLAIYWGEPIPVVGASAAISAHVAAAIRFIFAAGGPLSMLRHPSDPRVWSSPALTLPATFRDPRAFLFAGIWVALNVLFGLFPQLLTNDPNVGIAWEAHIGGFIVGLLVFGALDPVARRRS